MTDERRAIWESLLTAELNVRYWKYLVTRYSTRDRNLKIFIAVMASSVVGSWVISDISPYLWKILSVISAVVSIVSPILNYQESIKKTSELAKQWEGLRIEYLDLYRLAKISQDGQLLTQEYKKFRPIEKSLQVDGSILEEDKALKEKCFHEVKKVKNLT